MKITIYIATSVNGLVSNSRNVPDWLSREYGEGFVDICHKATAVIMGRKTYDLLAPDHVPLISDGIVVVRTSQRTIAPANPSVVFTSDNPHEIVSMLKEKGHSEVVIIGGATTISEFVGAGLVNAMVLVIEPVLFGEGGLPLLTKVTRDYKLTLLDSTRVTDNTLRLHYQISE